MRARPSTFNGRPVYVDAETGEEVHGGSIKGSDVVFAQLAPFFRVAPVPAAEPGGKPTTAVELSDAVKRGPAARAHMRWREHLSADRAKLIGCVYGFTPEQVMYDEMAQFHKMRQHAERSSVVAGKRMLKSASARMSLTAFDKEEAEAAKAAASSLDRGRRLSRAASGSHLAHSLGSVQ